MQLEVIDFKSRDCSDSIEIEYLIKIFIAEEIDFDRRNGLSRMGYPSSCS